jgi:hypothetical protein
MPEGAWKRTVASMSKSFSKGERKTSGKSDREFRRMRKTARKAEGEK